MDVRMPAAIRRSSVLFAVSAVFAALAGIAAAVVWWRVGVVADAYHALGWQGRELRDVDGAAAGVRRDLGSLAVAGPVTAVVATILAVVIRRPGRWARTLGMWFAGAATLIMFVGINSTPYDMSDETTHDSPITDLGSIAAAHPGIGAFPFADVYVYLAVGLGVIVLGTLIAAGIQLSRASAVDHFRPASRQDDSGWGSFVERQRERRDGGA